MFNETYKLLKACADRCKLCGCYKLPTLLSERKFGEDIGYAVMKCKVCGVRVEGKNVYDAMFKWNRKQRGYEEDKAERPLPPSGKRVDL